MFGGGRGMGGGGGGGGSMLKVVSRSVARAGVTNLQETLSSNTSTATNSSSSTAVSRSTHKLNSSNNNLSLCSASGSCTAPIYSGNNISSWPSFSSGDSACDESEWVSVDGNGSEEERSVGDFVLGPVPSLDEVHSAVSALTQVFDTASYSEFVTDKFACTDVANQISSPTGRLRSVSPVGSEADWIEPSMHLCNSRMFHPYSPDRVYDAFHLLQHEPSVKRMVISLSSDKAVWNAVLNNDVVRELRETYNAEENNTPPTLEGSDETSNDSNPAMNAVKWIFENTKAKFMEVFEKITTLINELFKAHVVDNKTTGTMDPFEERLKTSFMLSVVVLLVVVVTRAHRA
ncbi:uncharacterized protein LOC126675038 isoform X1 [Mercurialis annua]|uniref:uncharacterized protein LOC126675038 isoform X1 n=1 Tax=Mercurialis annua TaxID=3986 RepID=UPI002160FC72|nr:uncharacterized protein LOC126675038 isoform X1 [Mercurialis annua]